MKDQEIIQRMKYHLKPSGGAPIVTLNLRERFFHKEFIDRCIDELERMPMRIALGDMPSNLEKLAYQLLLDSAYIDPKAEDERKARMAEYEKNLEAKNE